MEQPFAKRRRLSPSSPAKTTSVTPNARPRSNGGIAGSASRPSFVSPTKASLAKFNPDLLPSAQSNERRRSAKRSPNKGTPISKSIDNEDTVNGDRQGHQRSVPPRVNGEALDPEERDGEPKQHIGLSAAPRRRSRTPSAQPTESKSAQTQSVYGTRGSKLAASARAHQLNGNTGNGNSAKTQGHKQQSGINIDQSSLDKLPATPTPHGIPPGATRAESSGSSLPPTPSQLGLEAPMQRPKGLLFGKPDKVAKSAQKKKEAHFSASREPEEPRQGEDPAVDRPTTSQLGPKLFLSNLPIPPPTAEQAELRLKTGKCTELEREVLTLGSGVLRNTLFSSRNEPAATESASLQKQRRKLQDISERLIRLRGDIYDLRTFVDSSANTAVDNLAIDTEPPEITKDTANSKLTGLPRKLAQFFPFLNNNDAAQLRPASKEESPHLFRRVKISDSRLDDSSPDSDSLLQSHDAWFMSEDGLVEVKLRIKFDSRSFQISDMHLLPLSKSGAKPGILPALKEWISRTDGPKELFHIGRAVSRCSDLAENRENCWKVCRERFDDLVLRESTENKHFRDNEVIFRRKDMTLTIRWNIALKDDGAAQSELFISPEFPQAWWEEQILLGREVEDARAAFELLVTERGVTEAITAMVKLLFPNNY